MAHTAQIKDMRKAPTVAVVLSILFALSSAQEWTPGTFPNPSQQSGSQACGRKGVQSSVCDPDHLISYASANVVSIAGLPSLLLTVKG